MNSKIRLLIILPAIFFSAVIPQTKISGQVAAGFYKRAADSLAALHAIDAKLMLIYSNNIDYCGFSNNWEFIYCSHDSLKEYHFITSSNELIFEEEMLLRVGIGVIDINWIDSDSALSIAELSGGKEFRNQYPSANTEATLVNYVTPEFSTYWRIDYKYNDNKLTVHVNAQTGVAVTSVDKTSLIDYSLYQNYPNPFNPITKIQYEIPVENKVTIKIFDILGREVTTLLEKFMKPGIYEVSWNAKNNVSGVYFYKIKSGDFTSVKKMIVLK